MKPKQLLTKQARPLPRNNLLSCWTETFRLGENNRALLRPLYM